MSTAFPVNLFSHVRNPFEIRNGRQNCRPFACTRWIRSKATPHKNCAKPLGELWAVLSVYSNVEFSSFSVSSLQPQHFSLGMVSSADGENSSAGNRILSKTAQGDSVSV